MSAIQHCVVVIPSRNEEALLGRCLVSVRHAEAEAVRQLGSSAPTVSVIVVADGCTDGTADVARSFPGVVVVESPPEGVGAARARGAAVGLGLTTCSLESTWIANTDADSAVHPQWLVEQTVRAAQGAEVYLGDVRPDFADLTQEQRDAWLATHVPGVARGNVHGANLGIRASAYLAIGGFRPRETGEDVQLVDFARQADLAVALSATEVLTSGRSRARATGGYSHYLSVELLEAARNIAAG